MIDEWNTPPEDSPVPDEFHSPPKEYHVYSDTARIIQEKPLTETLEINPERHAVKETSGRKQAKVRIIAMLTAAVVTVAPVASSEFQFLSSEFSGPQICSGCGGEQIVECPVCHGEKTVPCDQELCQTKGWFSCTWCHGEIYVECDNCSGSGVEPNDPEHECFRCKGSGKMICPRCDGAGVQICDRCHGRGYNDCGYPWCDDGFVPCEECCPEAYDE